MIDALDDEQLDKEIKQEIAARSSFATALNKEKLLEILRETVDTSTCLDFVSKRHRRHISPFRPELELVFNIAAAQELYPDLADALVNFNDDKVIRTARTELVYRELMNKVIAFFTAAFKYVLDGKVPEHYAEYEERVHQILDGRSTEVLRDQLIDIFQVKDKDGNLTERTGFTFSVVNAVSIPQDYATDDSVTVEIAY
jgi:hypothetical protein